MRRKHLILASCIISALLLTLTFYVSADENVTADSGAASNSAPLLDSYFWDNYTLLPYIESSGNQYIDTGIKPSTDLICSASVSGLSGQFRGYIFGSRLNNYSNNYSISYYLSEDKLYFTLFNNNEAFDFESNYYGYYIFKYDGNKAYLNNELFHTFSNSSLSNNYNIYLLALNSEDSWQDGSSLKLYNFYIYDKSLNDPNDPDSGEVGYLRYYYPARSKSGDVIGLYDAVSKTFVTTSTSSAFTNPVGSDADMGISANIVQFINAGLGWIGDILEYAITEPIILFFMAIGLCGVAFRWARRVYHF